MQADVNIRTSAAGGMSPPEAFRLLMKERNTAFGNVWNSFELLEMPDMSQLAAFLRRLDERREGRRPDARMTMPAPPRELKGLRRRNRPE